MKNLDQITTLLSDWLTGMVLVSINYAAGFVVRLERDQPEKDKPSVLRLTIKSSARFGSEENWKGFLSSLPLKARRGEIDEPGLGYRLILALGAQIKDIKLQDDGLLSLSTNDKEELVIPGTEDVWEESWALEELKEVAGEEAKSIVCDSYGKIFFE